MAITTRFTYYKLITIKPLLDNAATIKNIFSIMTCIWISEASENRLSFIAFSFFWKIWKSQGAKSSDYGGSPNFANNLLVIFILIMIGNSKFRQKKSKSQFLHFTLFQHYHLPSVSNWNTFSVKTCNEPS